MATASPFVGRAKEQAELLAHIEMATAGSGGLILVGGEAGAGKTALLRAVLRAGTALAVTGRCPGPDETPPFGPWAEAIQKLHHDLGWETTPLPPPFGDATNGLSAYELAGALAHWFGHRGAPLMLVMEDLHWADAASLDLLRHLPTRLMDWPVLVIGTYRTDELSRHHPLWHLLPEVQRAGAARILLDRLTCPEVAELLTQMLPAELNADSLAALVHERTAGLALFVREMVELVARTGQLPGPQSPLPQTLQQAIDSKLDRLPPGVLTALEPAAVMGEQFSFDLLEQVSQMAEDDLSEALEAAMARHVIRPQDSDGTWFTFDHALFRESLLFRLIGARRRRWHARIAAALEAGSEPDLDAIAYHLTRAGDSRAAKLLFVTADRARHLGALVQARERYEQALALLPAAHPDRPELLLKLAWCLQWADPTRTGAICQEAITAAEAAGDHAVLVWSRHVLLNVVRRRNDPFFEEQAIAVVAAQEELLADLRYQRLEKELCGGLAGYPRAATNLIGGLTLGGAPEKARAHLQAILPRALPSAGADILNCTVALALLDGNLAVAADQCGHAGSVSHRLRHYRGALLLCANEMMIRLIGPADQPEELDLLAERLHELEAEAWQQAGYALTKRGFSLTGVYQYYRGDWQGAYHNVVEAARQEPGSYGGTLLWYAGHILLRSGAPTEARPFVEAVLPLRPTDPIPINSNLLVLVHTLRAELCLVLGDAEQARAWLEAAERWPALSTAPFFRANVRLGWSAYFCATGDSDQAWQSATDALADAQAASSHLTAIGAHRQLGELSAARGESQTAMEHFEHALSLAEACRFPFEAALIRLARGQALGAPPSAVADLEAACAFFDGVGCTPMLALARAALGQAEGRPDPKPVTALRDGLTEREAEVVALVCQGMTDREIAARLFISHKTVDRHLRNIFNKTGVSKRAALAIYAVRHGLIS